MRAFLQSLAIAALFAAPACGGGGSSDTSLPTDGGCPVGTEGCACFQDTCFEPWTCIVATDVCVDLGGETGESSSAEATTTTTDATTTDSTTTDSTTTGDGDGDGDGDASTTDPTTATTDPTTSTTGDGDGDGDGDLGELERCFADTDCADPLVCRATVKNGISRCVAGCVSTAQCPANFRCQDDGTGTKRCLGSDVGRTCTAADNCNFACLLGQNYCTDACQSGSDCPNGWGCMPVGTPAQNVCVKNEALCDATDTSQCIAPSACDTGPNMILSGCTSSCNTAADCPQRAAGLAPWTCDGGGLCRRPADVYGPLPGGYTPAEYYCDAGLNVVNLCNDAQHIDFSGFSIPAPPSVDCFASVSTSGAANDSCVNSCLYAAGCTDGFMCTGVGSIGGGRIGLCLINGGTETGEVCTSNSQCEFGYCSSGRCSRDCSRDGLCTAGTSCVAGGAPTVEGLPFMRCE